MNKFDYVIGNPPYVIGELKATLYHKFVELAEKLSNEKYIMLVPSSFILDNRHIVTPIRKKVMNSIIHYEFLSLKAFVETKTKIKTGVFICDKIGRKNPKFTVIDRENNEYEVLRGVEFFDHQTMMNVYEKLKEKVTKWGYFFKRPGLLDYIDITNDKVKPYNKLLNNISIDNCIISDNHKGYQQDVDKWRVVTSYNNSGPCNSVKDKLQLKVSWVIPPDVGLPMTKGKADFVHRYVIVDNEEQGNSLVSYLRTNFVNYVLTRTRTYRNFLNNQGRYIPRMPLDRIWDDEQLIEHFEFDDKIANTIRRFDE